jgi:hypothetical protein
MRTFLVAILILNSALGFGQEAVFFAEDNLHKFPKTNEGPILEHVFAVTNNGTAPLVITEAKVSCHCTKVTFPDTIQPGKTDSIHVTFDTNGKYYQQDRKILLFTNTKKGMEELRFKVFVVPKEE